MGVGAGLDEEMIGRDLRGLGPARVDRDDAAAPTSDRLQALLDVRPGHQAALGDERIAAHADEEIRPLEIRDREHPRLAQHVVERHVLRELVHRSGGEGALRAERVDQRRQVELAADVVAGRIADVEAVRVRAVGLLDRVQALRGVVERRVPVDLLPAAVLALAQGATEALGIFVDLLHRVGLGTEVALAALVEGVTFDADHAAGCRIDLDVEAAARLAGRAGAVDDLRVRGHFGVPRTLGLWRRFAAEGQRSLRTRPSWTAEATRRPSRA